MGFANQRCTIAVIVKHITDGGDFLGQFGAEGVSSMLAGIQTGDPAGPGWGAGRIHGIGTVKGGTPFDEAIKIRGPDFRIQITHRAPVLLVCGNKEDIGFVCRHCGVFLLVIWGNDLDFPEIIDHTERILDVTVLPFVSPAQHFAPIRDQMFPGLL
jgi:hypothetical protein